MTECPNPFFYKYNSRFYVQTQMYVFVSPKKKLDGVVLPSLINANLGKEVEVVREPAG